MAFIDDQLMKFKELIENAIMSGGIKAKESLIRSSSLIQLIHDAIKYELKEKKLNPNNIFPHFQETKPEIILAGYLKQKKQDICVFPSDIVRKQTKIDWGPLAFEKKTDPYGFEYSRHSLVINVRSQMSSLAKNTDTLFERTVAESLNLHMRYKDIVLGEVYLIPAYEYSDSSAKMKKVDFSNRSVDLEKYISFFNAINNRTDDGPAYKYESCALLIVDFRPQKPKLYSNNQELIQDDLLSPDFKIDYSTLSFDTFLNKIISVYDKRFNLSHLETS